MSRPYVPASQRRLTHPQVQGGERRRVHVSQYTLKQAPRNMTGPVTMSSTLYQMSGSALPPACPRAVNDVTVTMKP